MRRKRRVIVVDKKHERNHRLQRQEPTEAAERTATVQLQSRRRKSLFQHDRHRCVEFLQR